MMKKIRAMQLYYTQSYVNVLMSTWAFPHWKPKFRLATKVIFIVRWIECSAFVWISMETSAKKSASTYTNSLLRLFDIHPAANSARKAQNSWGVCATPWQGYIYRNFIECQKLISFVRHECSATIPKLWTLFARARERKAAHSFASEAKLAGYPAVAPSNTRTDRQTDSQTVCYAPLPLSIPLMQQFSRPATQNQFDKQKFHSISLLHSVCMPTWLPAHSPLSDFRSSWAVIPHLLQHYTAARTRSLSAHFVKTRRVTGMTKHGRDPARALTPPADWNLNVYLFKLRPLTRHGWIWAYFTKCSVRGWYNFFCIHGDVRCIFFARNWALEDMQH